MMEPLVSILIPTFNYGDYIGETLTNVLAQSYDKWECIIMDDGSTDETPKIVHQYSERDRRIRYNRQSNKGLSAARNSAFRLASGKFIQLLDSDDLLSPHKIERQVALMENHPEIGISYTDAVYFRHGNPNEYFRNFEYIKDGEFELNDTQWIPQVDWTNQCDLIEYLFTRNIAPVNSMLINRDVFDRVGGFDESFTLLEDWHFFSVAAVHGVRFSYCGDHDAYAKVRVHTDSMSYKGEKLTWHHMKVLREMERNIHRLKLPCSSPTKLIASRGRLFIKQSGLSSISSFRSLAELIGLGRAAKLYLKELNAARKRR